LDRKDTLAKKAITKTAVKAPAARKKTVAAEKTPKKMTSRQFAILAGKLSRENKCSEIVVMDLRGLSNTTDYFVIATGTSNRQMRTVADEITRAARANNQMRFGIAGYEQARWIVLDFIDVVVHIFDQEYRNYYALEMLWGDAKRVRVPLTKLKQER
jgi:ribosome-associated protein